MLDNSVYINHPKTTGLSTSDIPAYFNSLMAGNIKSIIDCILVIAAYCGYISYEEICSLFPGLSIQVVRNIFMDFRKDNCLATENIPHTDGTAKYYFRITKKGFHRAQRISEYMLPQWNKYPRKPVDNESRNLSHTYSVGYNFIQMLMLNIPIEWRREISDSFSSEVSGRIYNKNGSLWTDAVCSVFPDDSEKYRLIYFEQDMLSEHNRVLVNKLRNYHSLRLMNYSSDMIVFSFRKTGISFAFSNGHVSDDTFSVKKCKALLELMTHTKEYDALALLEYTDISDEFKQYILNFLSKVNAVKIIETEEGVRYSRTDVLTDLNFVKSYYQSLLNHTNPYMFEELNKSHCHLANLRLFYAARTFLSNVNNLPNYVWPLLKGFQVLYMPTSLVANHVPYGMLSLFPDKVSILKRCLRQYFGDVIFEAELSKTLTLSNGQSICLRNSFTYSYADHQGEYRIGHVCVEFPSMDLGSWLRVFLFSKLYDGNEPYNTICVFDSEEQSREFFSTFNTATSTYVALSKSNVFYVYAENLSDDRPLFIDADILHHRKILGVKTFAIE